MRGDVIISLLGQWAGLFAVLTAVYYKTLNCTLIYDDVAMVQYFPPYRPFPWYQCFLPMDGGFCRPIYMAYYAVVWKLFGLDPLPNRLMNLALHTTVAMAAGRYFRQITGTGLWAGLGISLSVALASVGFVSAFYVSNSGDMLLCLGILASLFAWGQWLKSEKWLWVMATLGAVLFSVGSKEAGVAVGGMIILQTWIRGRRDRRAWLISAFMLALCLVAAGLFYQIQAHNPYGYIGKGYAERSLWDAGRRVFRYLAATILPGTFVLKPLWGVRLLPMINGVIGVLTAAAVLGAAVMVVRRREALPALSGVFLLAATGILVPVSIVQLEAGPHSPIGRYAYTPMVLVILALGTFGLWLHGRYRRAWVAGAIVWGVWLPLQVVIIQKSPGTKDYYRTSREWKALRKQIGKYSPEWPPMTALSVFSGPAYGSFFLDEAYGTAILRVYYPRLLMAYCSNRIIPETSRVYTFNGRKLTFVPK